MTVTRTGIKVRNPLHSLERIPNFYSVGIECLKNLNIIKKMTDTLETVINSV